MKGIIQDPQASLVNEVYAVIYSPKKRGRARYPENCVTEMPDEEAARNHADPSQHLYAAKVCGPARSSEGFKMYYLLEWMR